MRNFEEKIIKWQEQTKRFDNCKDDWERCPICSEQLYFCSCHETLAQEALEELYEGDGEGGSKGVIISVERLRALTRAEDKLSKLEAYGVDNWSGYSDAMSDSEGIFEEDEEEEEE